MNLHRALRIVLFSILAVFLKFTMMEERCRAEPPLGLPPLMEIDTGSILERGMPIAWHTREVFLLRTDGSIKQLDSSDIRSHKILNQSFQPEQAIKLRGNLQREFGSRFAVDGNGSFAIVAPIDSIRLWRDRFAQLQRSFDQYFRTRGYPLKPLDFPLVGIVFPSSAEFQRHAQEQGIQLQVGTVGYYSPVTNRLYAYEMKDGSDAAMESLATVWHEAAHQIAFNRGIHQRLSSPPLWMLEGLASIFEAPGMMSARATLSSSDLINRSRWDHWRRLMSQPEAMASLLEGMIVDDNLFRSSPHDAYTIAWGISLYLAERDTNNYMTYVHRMSRLEVGQEFSAGQRMSDFKQAFRGNPLLLIKSADRYLSEL